MQRRPPHGVNPLSSTLGEARTIGTVLALLVGGGGGVGAYTFIYADGGAYLRDDAAACANCHIMQSNYDAWIKSSHRTVASCNDCHAPHSSLPAKLWVKGRNGLNHSLAFTTGRFHEPIQITRRNRIVTEAACRYCHQEIVSSIDPVGQTDGELSCIRCHDDVGHP